MSILTWLSNAANVVLDSDFIYSDLKDVFLTGDERIAHGEGDSASRMASMPNGYTISNDHVYYNGHDCGPVGKFVG